MNNGDVREPIRWDEWLVHGIGESPQSGQQYYMVLSRDCFGWSPTSFPVNHPIAYPKHYHVIPLFSIIIVEILRVDFVMRHLLRIHYDTREEPPRVFEATVLFPHRWATAFQSAGVPVQGANSISLGSFKGLVNNYGWYGWFALLGIGMVAVIGFTLRFDPANRTRNIFIAVALIPLLNLLFVLVMAWVRRSHE